jgi:GNAT superfamily N-acetyltransferase
MYRRHRGVRVGSFQAVAGIRPARLPDDGDFLLSLYASTRLPELAGLGWSQAETDAFIRMQFGAQASHFRAAFPRADYSVICVHGERAGRLIVDRYGHEFIIVDLSLLPEFRGMGIGRGLVRRLLDEADAGRLAVRCHVLRGSDARPFWERAGFLARDDGGAYVAMERATPR